MDIIGESDPYARVYFIKDRSILALVQVYTYTDRLTYRQTCRQTDSQTDRQMYRQTDKQRDPYARVYFIKDRYILALVQVYR